MESAENEPSSDDTTHARFLTELLAPGAEAIHHYSLMRVVTAKLVAREHERITALADELARHPVMTGEAVIRLLGWPTRRSLMRESIESGTQPLKLSSKWIGRRLTPADLAEQRALDTHVRQEALVAGRFVARAGAEQFDVKV